MELKDILGRNIKYYREMRHLSQEQLSFRADMNRNYLGDIERGKRNPTIKNVEKIAKALEIPAEDLLAEEEWIHG